MRSVVSIVVLAGVLSACTAMPDKDGGAFRTRSFEKTALFPVARGLSRPEDGVALPDGRIIVGDQTHGLVVISPDQSKRPFGKFAEAGYRHVPHTRPAGPNGVSLEPDRAHLLIADVFTGAIYRVSIETEVTKRVYKHPFGVNTAIRDSSGAIWFTQSTQNRAGPKSEERLLSAPMNRFVSDGALYRIAPPSGRRAPAKARRVLSGLSFANGIAIDEGRGALYLNETMGNRVTAYRLSVQTGALSDGRVIANVLTPDNIELDERGRLWVASPIRNEIVMIDPDSGETKSVFRAQTADNDRIAAEWRRRGDAREPMLELFTPNLWAPMPGPVTGVIFTRGGGPVYVSGLGDALIKLER